MLALALARELTPVVTSIIVAGRVGSAFAAELGTMQVSEQTDSLRWVPWAACLMLLGARKALPLLGKRGLQLLWWAKEACFSEEATKF